MELVIGNKNYSTWSLRPWLLLDYFGITFEEVMVSLAPAQLSQRLGQYSSASKVPVLIDGEVTVWDSLAICEHINDQYLQGRGWPQSLGNRALARSISAQMHSGFGAMRNEMPMNIRAKRRLDLSTEALRDISQVQQLWSNALEQSGGPWLGGEFSIADCMFAPVVMRFITYGIELTPEAQAYADRICGLSSMKKWIDCALQETEVIAVDEAGV